ncbi:hypothetical protein I4U23_013507 [Adineta vaga]|nr:hypothetical protein I4U23_013507 [Adineta vaga]
MMKYSLVIIVLLGCWCKNNTVNVNAAMEKTDVKPEAPILPVGVIASKPKPVTVEGNKDAISPKILLEERRKTLTAASTDNNPSKKEEKTSNNDTETKEKLDLCARMMCPMIYCENSLPAIPSQGICCQRCINDPKCNTSECPKFKCGTHLIPANVTAGECCDRCAPATTKAPVETKQSKTTTKPKKLAKKPRNHKSSSSSSSSSAEERKNGQNHHSSEENEERPLPCNLHARHSKPNENYSKLIRLLTKTLVHLRRSHSYHRQHHSSESVEY